ncbi:hypothetical protein ABEB36_010874 [Hypothenemus hampei]|uniref:Secreted protein n=1 Tax=Hypothenemus hampei TaxID=57062 RepID=A0ABD1EE17_HYPHA
MSRLTICMGWILISLSGNSTATWIVQDVPLHILQLSLCCVASLQVNSPSVNMPVQLPIGHTGYFKAVPFDPNDVAETCASKQIDIDKRRSITRCCNHRSHVTRRTFKQHILRITLIDWLDT